MFKSRQGQLVLLNFPFFEKSFSCDRQFGSMTGLWHLVHVVDLVLKRVQEFVQEKSIPLSQWSVHQGSHEL